MPKDDKDLAKETSEAIDKIEVLLSEALSFTGRYLATIWYYLVVPSLSASNSSRGAPHGRILYPLSFLTSSLLLFSLSYFRVLKELLDLNWISQEFKALITRIVAYHDSIAESAFALQIADALLLMVPLVLFIALFAKINEIISIMLRKRTSIDQQLSSTGYFIGTLTSMLTLWSLPILYLVAAYKAAETLSIVEKTIGGLVIILAVGTIFLALFRYLQDCKNQYFKSWALSCLVFALASFLQIVAARVIIQLFLLGGA